MYEATQSGANAAYTAAAAATGEFKPLDGDNVECILDIPQALVGRIIGRGGDTIRDLQVGLSFTSPAVRSPWLA